MVKYFAQFEYAHSITLPFYLASRVLALWSYFSSSAFLTRLEPLFLQRSRSVKSRATIAKVFMEADFILVKSVSQLVYPCSSYPATLLAFVLIMQGLNTTLRCSYHARLSLMLVIFSLATSSAILAPCFLSPSICCSST